MIVAAPWTPYIDRMKRQRTWRGGVGLVVWLALAAVGGCGGGGTAPDPGAPPVIGYTPAVQGQQLAVGDSLVCAATVTPGGALAVTLAVTWRLGGAVVGSDPAYTYRAVQVGRDTLRAHGEAGETTRDYFWVIDVAPEPETTPPAVPNAIASPGPDPVQVVLTWNRVANAHYPLVGYDIVLSYTGLVTAGNWGVAQSLGTVAHVPGQSGYSATFDRDHGSLVAGAEAWFAIRARDDHGQLSTTVVNRYTRITTEWWIDGIVTDDLGEPLLGVIVGSDNPVRNSNSDGDGRYRLGPFRSIDDVEVRTTSLGYYDYLSSPLRREADITFSLVLPRRWGVDPACTAYDGDFLTYFRFMTHTETAEADTSASRLWKWDHWPLTVFLPDSTSATGRDLDGLGRAMLELWNTSLGETYLVETTTDAGADIHVAWVEDASAGYGETELVLPAGGVLGDVVPRRVRIEVEAGLMTDQFFQEVTLHELGHALGLVGHSVFCEGAGHLMVFGASGNLSLASPIHPDEQRAVRALRRLPQGADMARFEP